MSLLEEVPRLKMTIRKLEKQLRMNARDQGLTELKAKFSRAKRDIEAKDYTIRENQRKLDSLLKEIDALGEALTIHEKDLSIPVSRKYSHKTIRDSLLFQLADSKLMCKLLKQQIEEKESQNTRLRQQLKETNGELGEIEEELSNKNADFMSLSMEYDETTALVEDYRLRMSEVSDECDKLHEVLTEMEKANDDLRESNEELQRKLSESERSVSSLHDVEDKSVELEKERDDVIVRCIELEKQNEKQLQSIEKYAREQKSYLDEISRLETTIKQLRTEKEKVESSKKVFQGDLEAAIKELKEERVICKTYKQEVDMVKARKEKLAADQKDKDLRMSQLEEEVSQQKTTIATLSHQLKHTKTSLTAAGSTHKRLQEALLRHVRQMRVDTSSMRVPSDRSMQSTLAPGSFMPREIQPYSYSQSGL
ncbi:hypothetical protein ADUPG1_011885 [Aduncisulcus paluster]|uniref:Uncharacterized protein n=1 Tax=Aduncisulcus paluster TaxID=2918883 RepID=A0ABQ5K2D6_9EUKA|nr:hypothetical protein ADUPG1_011885 [Aduncisulcus paluster]